MNQLDFNEIKLEAQKLGLHLVSSVSRTEVEERLKLEIPRLNSWQQDGYAGDLGYMLRPDSLLCRPENLLSSYQSILTFLVPYSSGAKSIPECPRGFGKVARYAQGLDYHQVLKQKLLEFVSGLNLNKEIQFKVFTDSVPTLERAIASESALGFIGKSSMLISPTLGTYTFICEVIWDVQIKSVSSRALIKSRCGSCIKCRSDCPTGAIVSDYKIDARKCISYLSIEKRGVLSLEEGEWLGDWIFGCDICQEVCPHNSNKDNINLVPESFQPKSGVGAYLNIGEILTISSDEEFRERFHGTALLRTKRSGLLRNAMMLVRNQKLEELICKIEFIASFDKEEMLRSQARLLLEELR